ncbi:heterokaryon incompatibility protein-domain-containing protein [Nemania sp. FL0031]|nr:heterokaryon incompatibility protein-domain-containing protein [Nemania sp. FL0031]
MATFNHERGLTTFRYEPLPEDYHTRALELYPALDTNAPLHGTFRYVDLNVDPFYDAVSYAWGEPNFTEEITMNGDSRLYITQNLRDALIRFRHPVEKRSIWADAICINQNDNNEKRWQLELMAEIFRCASSVLVWLGGDSKAETHLHKVALLS